MTEWTFRVPDYPASPWYSRRRLAYPQQDMTYPRLGVYCAVDHPLWLCGSLVVDPANLEDHNRIHWAWQPTWLSGDGWLFDLEPGAPQRTSVQSLVNDALYDPEAIRQRLMSCAIDSAESSAAVAELNTAQDQTRARYLMKCSRCRNGKGHQLKRTFRAELVQNIASTLWINEVRELPLREFAARVANAAR